MLSAKSRVGHIFGNIDTLWPSHKLLFCAAGGSLKDAQTIIEWQTKIDESSAILANQSQAWQEDFHTNECIS